LSAAKPLAAYAPLCVVLSRPETPENIGFVARSMIAYGVNDLRLVGIPRVPEDSKAYWTTCGGEDVLRHAKYFATVEEAVADCVQALGFTKRVREKSQRLFDFGDVQKHKEGRLEEDHPHYAQLPVFPEFPDTFNRSADDYSEIVDVVAPSPDTPLTALVFGCESQGLSHEETVAMTHLVRIALAAGDMSLNLSHAVTVVLHALTAVKSGPRRHPHAGRASTLEESNAALVEFLEALDRTGYLSKSGKESVRSEKIRVLWRRMRPTAREIDFIRGALKALAGTPSKRLTNEQGSGDTRDESAVSASIAKETASV
jgi:tRNA C32,U32 (ribose-2'-O)-methylase TrmJ